MLVAALIGAALGFVAAIPVAGPIAALVLSRALQQKLKSALFVAIGAAVAEALYAGAAFYGVGALDLSGATFKLVSDGAATLILLVVGVLLIHNGRTFKLEMDETKVAKQSAWKSASLGFGICALNPTLIATWTTAMVPVHASGYVEAGGPSAVTFMLGVVLGTVGWNALLLMLVKWMHGKLNEKWIGRIQIGTGVLVIGLAVWFGVRFVQTLMAA